MKRILLFLPLLILPLVAKSADFREHRAIYVTPYLADWPTSAITTANAEQHKRILRKNLDKYKTQNINVLYYHVRSNCDATYKSAYEPWSPGVGGTRGNEPAFDPLAFLLEEAHARGIEVYAWVNPYRYCGVYTHGESPLDYELTHPEWLIVQSGKETILNPALEEVKQRICDVITDIISNYDVDGVIFDDYFYSNPTPYELDADLYNAAYAADPSVGTQLEWRVNNINSLIKRVYETIKSVKPYLVFGISPAGVASPPNVTSEYGLEAAPDYDWQYDAIASDPLNWYKNHYVDFMAPQIYWPSKFDILEDWWIIASRKFQRHLYSAVTLSDYNTYKGAEYIREVEYARAQQPQNESGIGFFNLSTYNNSQERVDNVLTPFGDYLGATANTIPALTPLRPWNNVYSPVNITGLTRTDNVLSWDEVQGMRYTLYAFAPGEELKPFNTNLVQVLYTNSYTIDPEAYDGYTFGVCAYDRYGNEYPMSTEGATLSQGTPAVLTYPVGGVNAAALFDFTWQPNSGDDVIEVSTDPDFAELLVQVPAADGHLNSYAVPCLTEGTTYYWRVRNHPVNGTATVSETASFVASRVAVTAPFGKDATDTPTITWTPAYEGSNYIVEVGRNAKFTIIDFTGETSEPSITVEKGKLKTGYNYYVRVTAERQGRVSQSDVATFSTADVVYDAPTFVNPTADGIVLHSNECVSVADWSGLSSITLQISASESFPARTSYKLTLRDGEVSTPELSTIKVASKLLEDGATYYVRACANYYIQADNSREQSSDYTISSFVYSSEAGVSTVIADDAEVKIVDNVLIMPTIGNDVAIYTPTGTLVALFNNAPARVSLQDLDAGLYIIRVSGSTNTTLKFLR